MDAVKPTGLNHKASVPPLSLPSPAVSAHKVEQKDFDILKTEVITLKESVERSDKAIEAAHKELQAMRVAQASRNSGFLIGTSGVLIANKEPLDEDKIASFYQTLNKARDEMTKDSPLKGGNNTELTLTLNLDPKP